MPRIRYTRILAVTASLLLSSCYEVDLLSVDVKEDLSSDLQIVISPSGNDTERTEEEKENFFKEAKEELENCGFTVTKNLRYDSAGVSGIQSFSSRTRFNQSVDCLSYLGGDSRAFYMNYPTKGESMFETTYNLRIGLANKSSMDDGISNQPVRRIQVSLPGDIKNPKFSSTPSDANIIGTEVTSKVVDLEVQGWEDKTLWTMNEEDWENLERGMIEYYTELGLDLSNVDIQDSEAIDRAFEEQLGISTEEEMEQLVNSKFPPEEYEAGPTHTHVDITSAQSKIGVDTTLAAIFGFISLIGSVVLFLKKRNKKGKSSSA